jgi:uncharacterized membrane protein YraQ (UPF0718 family)
MGILPAFLRYQWRALALVLGGFLLAYYLPVEALQSVAPIPGPVAESLLLVRWYAREHVLLCLVPAFFIAGAIGVFVSQAAVMRYLGAGAKRILAYGVASVSGSILAVCSCTVLPLFAGIYQRGAGLGPATAFLYAGPAINVLAIVLTGRVLGMELGLARAAGAVGFSVVIGGLMHLIFRREEAARAAVQAGIPVPKAARPLWQNALFFASMIGILLFANWGAPAGTSSVWQSVYDAKWYLTGLAGLSLAAILVAWFRAGWSRMVLPGLAVAGAGVGFPQHPVVPFTAGVVGLSALTATDRGELHEWFEASWGFARQILPLLLLGVLASGLLLGRPGHEGLIPSAWVAAAVGGNSLGANLCASVAGALMYFATLTEIPIVEGLLGAGMGKGPALALLLAGPALSLPSMLVLRRVMGTRKTAVFVGLTVVMATLTGLVFGALA